MAVKKLTKKQIDESVLKLLVLTEEIKKLNKEANQIKASLEAQYSKDKNISETISGILCEYEKIPVNNGAHEYAIDLVKAYTDKIGKTAEVISTIEVLNAAKFEELAKTDLSKEILDECRLNKWTFKSKFRRKEKSTQKAAKKVAQTSQTSKTAPKLKVV